MKRFYKTVISLLMVIAVLAGCANTGVQETTGVETTEATTDGTTEALTEAPTQAPTEPPTEASTEAPTQPPTEAPTEPPTQPPTEAPTEAPTQPPTEPPTEPPTQPPTQPPTEAPTEAPTQPPTEAPTQAPTEAPADTPTDTPTEAPTQAPTEAPTQPPTEAPTDPVVSQDPAMQPPSVSINTGLFHDAAFIGDSVTLKLRNYNAAKGKLGSATFLCQGSYSVSHAVRSSMLLSYQGQNMTPQDALKACGAKKVFILLGLNDIALWGIDTTINNWAKLIANIREVNPDIQIYIQSGTPIYTYGERGGLTNKLMDNYNVRLQAFAQSNGCHYIDIAKYLKDSAGGLAKVYCSDNFVHFTDKACVVWAKVLTQALGG